MTKGEDFEDDDEKQGIDTTADERMNGARGSGRRAFRLYFYTMSIITHPRCHNRCAVKRFEDGLRY